MMYNIKERITIGILNQGKKIAVYMFILSIYLGASILSAKNDGQNVFDITEKALKDFHIIIFVLLPLFLLCVVPFRDYINKTILIRHKSFFTYYLCEIIPILIIAAIFVFLLFFESFLLASISGLFLSKNEGNNFIGGILRPSIFLYFGLAFLSVIIQFLKYRVTKNAVLLIVIITYMLSVVAVQWNIDEILPYVFLNNYLVYDENFDNLQLTIQLLIMVIISSLTCITIKKHWKCSNL